MYYINKNIENLYRVKFHDERAGILRLDMNENPGGLPLSFVEEVKKKITPEFIATYPEKDRLAGLLAEHNHVFADNISITCGSDEAMRFIFQCFGEEGKNLLTVTPTFEMYSVYSAMFGMNHVMAEYNEDFTLNLESVMDRIDAETGIVILVNPNSPIGECWTEEQARSVIEKAAANNALVAVDEAYHYFCDSTFLPLINEYDNLIVLRTFSKIFSCAGLRIGYAVGNRQLIKYIDNAESTFNVNSIAILFAEELMKHSDMIPVLAEMEESGRKWLADKLSEKGYSVISKEGNYLLFKPHRSSSEVVSDLKERGVWVRDYSKGILAGWVRVSTGERKYMEKFFEALENVD